MVPGAYGGCDRANSFDFNDADVARNQWTDTRTFPKKF